MVARNCFVATIDLKDAYNNVSIISRQFQNFLIFTGKINCTILHVWVLGFGLGSCPRKFTKLKVPITTLHFENVPLGGYIDDSLTKRDTFSVCKENIYKKMRLYDNLGFVIKSIKLFSHKEIES